MSTPSGTPMTRRRMLAAAGTVALATTAGVTGMAEVATPRAAASPAGRVVPARTLPVPGTVSPQLAALIGAPLAVGWDAVPADAAGWRALAAQSADDPDLPALIDQLGVTVCSATIAGVPVFRIAPPRNAHPGRLLVHLHGGGYVLYPGEVGAGEGMIMAGLQGYEVVSVDYRMPPDHPFPAAVDDAFAVWQALVDQHDPRRMAVFGASAGGGLTLALVLRARGAGVPLPAAIAPGTPWVDLTADSTVGDSLHANEFVDNVLVSPSGWLGAAASLYADGHDTQNPWISPIYGDFEGLPPAILTSGTRDLLLSHTVRAHRRLRQAGVPAALQVFEGQSHAQFLEPFVPETDEAFAEIGAFLDAHLDR
ncbi:MAG TPA: alpha/beta hydrolase fold domain-containing protein [Blastococcus sp.]|nr:alpha/beta hydrolase fold domain-containing protein [Blastococcus sp.]